MEETEESNNGNKKCKGKTRTLRGKITSPPQKQYQYHQYQHHQLFHYSNQLGNIYNHNHNHNQNQFQYHRYYPALLPLPVPPIPLQLALAPSLNPPLNHHSFRPKTRHQKPSCKQNNPHFAASSETHVPILPISPGDYHKSSLLFHYNHRFCYSPLNIVKMSFFKNILTLC